MLCVVMSLDTVLVTLAEKTIRSVLEGWARLFIHHLLLCLGIKVGVHRTCVVTKVTRYTAISFLIMGSSKEEKQWGRSLTNFCNTLS
jgi:hypothetical protein